MIRGIFSVYDTDLEFHNSFTDRRKAEEYAAQRAEESETMMGVMLAVPVAEFPELRAVAVYDYQGRCIWSTDVYDPELVPV